MENRSDKARKLHAEGCNCCQAVLMAYADKLQGITSEAAMKISSPFGRGIAGSREVCGCVSAMAMVAGLTNNTSLVKSMMEQFRQENGDVVCGRLLALGKKPCNEMVGYAAALLEDFID